VISVEAARVDNAILLHYLASGVSLEEPEIGSTHPPIPIDNNCMYDELHFGMPQGRGNYKDNADTSDSHDTMPTGSWQRRPAMERERINLGASDGDGYDGKDGDHPDADEEEVASLADDGSMQNVED
jgi:hypothetical protein